MLSFNNIGNLGRLGNQMFQYASLKGIAKNRGFDFCIPPREVFGKFDRNVKNDKFCIYDVFDLEKSNIVQLTGNKVIRETGFNFDKNLFENCDDNVDLLGYFQSEKYFHHISDNIREDFLFKDEIYNECKSFYDDNFSNSKVVSLHVRRGDYLSNPNHPVQELDYYKKSIEIFDEFIPVLIFSDDPSWCEEQYIFKDDRFFISQGGDPISDLCIMTLCNYHIIANSSYSWWGSWLAKSEKTIAPKNWFAGDCASHNTKDLYCKQWIILGE